MRQGTSRFFALRRKDRGKQQEYPCQKVCFIASSGGHLEELLRLHDVMLQFDSFVVTESVGLNQGSVAGLRTHYIPEINRKEKRFFCHFIRLFVVCNQIYKKEKPDVVVTTGSLCSIPMLIIAKMHSRYLIYIESFARTNELSLSGKIAYKIVDDFYVQWESLLQVAPRALYKGSLL